MNVKLTEQGFDLLDRDERRIDGGAKVRGDAKYVADFTMDGMLFAALLMSPVPHAEIVSIDVSCARELPGVHAVLTGNDIGPRRLGRILFDWPVIANDKVRFIGDTVAAVAAGTPEQARAAAAAIDVTYRALPVVLDPEAAIRDDAPAIHQHSAHYAFIRGERASVPHRNMQGYELIRKGDPDAAFASAAHLFEHTFTTPRYFAGYIEPRAALVWIDGAGLAHVLSTNKMPFDLRDQFALTTGLPPESFIIEPAYIGGDFGSKGLSIEEFHCYYLARATGRPVKYVRTYQDDMRASVVRPRSTIRLKSGVDANGYFVAFDARLLWDGGAYAAGKPIPTLLPGASLKTPYRIPNARVERICAYTNTVPSGQVRDPAGVPTSFAIESHIDMIARELGIDPLAFRMQNAIRGDERDIDGTAYVEARGAEVLDAVRVAVGWESAPPAGRGRGIALTSRHVGDGKTSLVLVLQPSGAIEALTGTTEQGTGTLTVIARVIANVLRIEPDRISVTRGGTGSVPRDPGVGGSRATHLVGRAAQNAADELQRHLTDAGYPGVSWEAACRRLTADGPLEITGTYDDGHRHGDPAWHTFCATCVEASVDGETGEITVHNAVMAIDIGTIINPLAHRGQLHGGFGFGIGHALTEELRLEDGRIVNLSLADYKIPSQRDMPPFHIIELPAKAGPGPFGAKSVGELSTSGVPPALANAVAAACGARLMALPLTAERVFNSLHTAME